MRSTPDEAPYCATCRQKEIGEVHNGALTSLEVLCSVNCFVQNLFFASQMNATYLSRAVTRVCAGIC